MLTKLKPGNLNRNCGLQGIGVFGTKLENCNVKVGTELN
jgi:hypothetical protein